MAIKISHCALHLCLQDFDKLVPDTAKREAITICIPARNVWACVYLLTTLKFFCEIKKKKSNVMSLYFRLNKYKKHILVV